MTWDDVKVTWYDTYLMLDTLKKWRESVWTPEKGLMPATDYKTGSILSTNLPDGTATNEWNLVNSWPSTIRYGDLTYTNSDIKIVDVTIAYDWAEEQPF